MNTLLVSLSSLLAENIIDWLFEALTKPLFAVISVFEGIFKGLAGVVDPQSSDIGMVSGSADSKNIIVQLFQSTTMQKIMASLMLFGIVVLVLSVILAIIRNVYKDDAKVTISSIIGQAIKAVIGFILVPSLCLVGVMVSNVILQAIDGATSASGTASFATGIYTACQREDSVDNIFNLTINGASIDYFGTIDSGSSGDGSTGETTTTEDGISGDIHMAGIVYAQYLWQLLTENYSPRGWVPSDYLVIDSVYKKTQYYSRQDGWNEVWHRTGEYIDVLGLKVQDDDILDWSDMNNWNNGNGIAEVIDTREDVELFYSMLLSQYTHNFPNATRFKTGGVYYGLIATYDYFPAEVNLRMGTGVLTSSYFGAGSDAFEPREHSFVYYYYGHPLFDYEGVYNGGTAVKDEKWVKSAYETIANNKIFGSDSSIQWTFRKTSSQWTNDNLNKTLCMGDDINYFYAFIASIMVAKSLFYLCWGMAKRIVQLALYYVLSPIALALYPFDNGKAFASWKNDFVGYTIGAFGAVAGVNLTIQLIPVINRVQIFSSKIYNDVTQLILYIILAQGMEGLVKTLSGWIGAKDLLAEGKATAKQTTEPIKKVAGTALKVAGTVAGGGVGMAIGLAKSGSAKKTLGNFDTLGAQDQFDEAQKAGFSSTAEYRDSLVKAQQKNSLGGQFARTAGNVWNSSMQKGIDTSFGRAFYKSSGIADEQAAAKGESAKAKAKADVESAFVSDYKSGVITAKADDALISKLEKIQTSLVAAETARSRELTTLGTQLHRATSLTAANATAFLETGDMSKLNGISANDKLIAQQARADYLNSASYNQYASIKNTADSFKIDGTTDVKVVFGGANTSLNALDTSAFADALKNGDETKAKAMIKALAGSSVGEGYIDAKFEQIKQLVAENSKHSGEVGKEAKESAQKKVLRPSAPKK